MGAFRLAAVLACAVMQSACVGASCLAAGVKDSLTTEVLDGLCGEARQEVASNTDHSNVSVWLMLASLATPARLYYVCCSSFAFFTEIKNINL